MSEQHMREVTEANVTTDAISGMAEHDVEADPPELPDDTSVNLSGEPPPLGARNRIQRTVTLGALLFLAAILAWPLVVLGLRLVGIQVSSFCN